VSGCAARTEADIHLYMSRRKRPLLIRRKRLGKEENKVSPALWFLRRTFTIVHKKLMTDLQKARWHLPGTRLREAATPSARTPPEHLNWHIVNKKVEQ